MNHSFDIKHAEQYGIPEAILIANFQHWINHNRANEKNFRNGRYWTYNSVKAFRDLFPYMSTKQIRRALDSLVNAEVLIEDCFNENKVDRTKWYAFKDECIFLLGPKQLPKKANANAQSGNSSIKTNINTDINTNTSGEAASGKYPQAFDDLWSAYPRKPGANKKLAFAKWQARINDGHTPEEMLQGVLAYAKYILFKKTEAKWIKNAETFLGPDTHFSSDWSIPASMQQAGESLAEQHARAKREAMERFNGARPYDPNVIDME